MHLVEPVHCLLIALARPLNQLTIDINRFDVQIQFYTIKDTSKRKRRNISLLLFLFQKLWANLYPNSFTKPTFMAIIKIENIEFHANHGHYKEEQLIGNTFLVDLEIEYNSEKAQKSDNLKDTVNYQKAFEIVKREMDINSHLLEHVCNRILESLFNELAGIDNVTVKVSKVNPPMGGKIEKVSVTLSKRAD